MALVIHSSKANLRVIAGYESGHTIVFALNRAEVKYSALDRPTLKWQKLYSAQPHSQPVLSLSASPFYDYYITSSADAILAKHPLLSAETAVNPDTKPLKLLQTKHSGQQGLCIRSDGKVFSTAGWDSRVRVYSAKTMKELAVLKWHKDGCFATAFADVGKAQSQGVPSIDPEPACLSGISGELAPAQDNPPTSTALATTHSSTPTVAQRRDLKAQTTHWLAAGSKDGKVSLWDIF